jgi:hypothetical protein
MERLTWRERRLIQNLRANVEKHLTMESAQREANRFYHDLMQEIVDDRFRYLATQPKIVNIE